MQTPHHLHCHEKLIHIDSHLDLYIFILCNHQRDRKRHWLAKHFKWRNILSFFSPFIFFLCLFVACAWCVCGIVVDQVPRHHMIHFIFFLLRSRFQMPYDRFLFRVRHISYKNIRVLVRRMEIFWEKYSAFRTWIATKRSKNKSVTYFALE